ncbi:MAG: DUF5591 domain-containing protein [Promethearchaeota archaeon]
MQPFFEVLNSKIGYSRIGRILISKEQKMYMQTPNILIPIKNILMHQLNFIEQFEKHNSFIITKEIFLKISFIRDKFKNTGFIFTHTGKLENFQKIITENLEIFSEGNILSIIPFNLPTTSINKHFAIREIKNYLNLVEKILKSNPNLNFGLTIKIFDFPELILLYFPLIKIYENIKVLNLADTFDNISNFRGILKLIIEVKKNLDNNVIIMASGKIIPKYYPILIYLGVDLIDSSYLLYLSAENFYDSIEYLLPIYKLKFFPCSCVACQGKLRNLSEDKYSSEKIDLLCLHNLISAFSYMNKIKQYLHYEDFRAFIEKSSFDDTYIISILRILDKSYFENVRFETPIVQESKEIKCFGPSSYYRPDFQEFRERVIENFEPEPWTKLIILLPCSAKKPYSESKSHKLFHKIIRKFPEFPHFQEFILTSPLGVVPRQLENIYPVNSYDISVTGEWNTEELTITVEMLIQILNKYSQDIPIICHLEDNYLEIANEAASKLSSRFIFSKIYGRATSKESLQSLENLIKEQKDKYILNENLKNNIISKTWIKKIAKILDYQFGMGSGKKFISSGINLKRTKVSSQIILIDSKNKEKLGVFKPKTGQVSLSFKGIDRIIPDPRLIKSNFIVFDGKEISGNTLFRPGIIDYTSDLIPNNFVIILDREQKNIIGMGRLLVGSNFIKNSKTGRIAIVYEKA